MKKTVILSAMLLSFVLSTSAKSQRHPEKPNAEKMTERMKTRLELSDEQYKSVYVANEEMIKMIDEAGGKEADNEDVEKIKKQHVVQLNEILTLEQMEKMKDGHQKRLRKREHSKIERIEE